MQDTDLPPARPGMPTRPCPGLARQTRRDRRRQPRRLLRLRPPLEGFKGLGLPPRPTHWLPNDHHPHRRPIHQPTRTPPPTTTQPAVRPRTTATILTHSSRVRLDVVAGCHYDRIHVRQS